jgi:hypothetical protein
MHHVLNQPGRAAQVLDEAATVDPGLAGYRSLGRAIGHSAWQRAWNGSLYPASIAAK